MCQASSSFSVPYTTSRQRCLSIIMFGRSTMSDNVVSLLITTMSYLYRSLQCMLSGLGPLLHVEPISVSDCRPSRNQKLPGPSRGTGHDANMASPMLIVFDKLSTPLPTNIFAGLIGERT